MTERTNMAEQAWQKAKGEVEFPEDDDETLARLWYLEGWHDAGEEECYATAMKVYTEWRNDSATFGISGRETNFSNWLSSKVKERIGTND